MTFNKNTNIKFQNLNSGGLYFLVLFFFTIPPFLFGQDLTLRTLVDRTKVANNQQFSLTIEISGKEAQSVGIPNPPDLSSFAILSGNSGTTSSFQSINGRMSVSKSATYNYIASTEGKFEIPSITINFNGNTYRSRPIQIEIVKGTTPPLTARNWGSRSGGIQPEDELEGNLYLAAEIDKNTVFRYEPVVVTYKIYTRVEVSNYSLTKSPDLIGFWTEEFEIPKQPNTYEEIIDGKRFLVAEIKKIALFPTQAGEKILEPMEIDCEVRLRSRRRSRDIFEDFFGSSSPFGQRVRTTIASEPLKITVKPLPLEGRPSDFSGAVGSFSWNATLDKNEVSTNEAITLKMKIKGSGNIKILPEPKFKFPQGFEIYEPEISQKINRSGDVISGEKVYEYVFIPRFAGTHRIKPISFVYFDPNSAVYKRLETPEFVIKAKASSGTGAPITSGLTREEIKFIGRDIRFIKESPVEFQKIGNHFYKSFLFGLLLGIPLVAFGGTLFYRQRQGKMEVNVAFARNRRANQMAKKKLAGAHKILKTDQQKEFYAEISKALFGFISDKLNLSAAGLNSDEVEEKLSERKVKKEVVEEVLSIVHECDFQRFAPSNATPEGMQQFYNRATSAISKLEKSDLS